MDVLSIGLEIDDRVADDLPGTVVGDIAAAAGFVDGDASRLEQRGRGEDVRAASVASDAEREHVGVLEQQQLVVNRAGFSLLHERALQRQRVVVRDAAKPTDA